MGVARQYCGRPGKQDNCQVAVTLSVANHAASLPVAHRLYLPEAWAQDPARRAKAGVPAEVTFKTKPEIAIDQIRAALADGIAPGVVLADAAYGWNGSFRAAITAAGLTYAVAVQSNAALWPPDVAPLPAKPWSGHGRPPSQLRRGRGLCERAAQHSRRPAPTTASAGRAELRQVSHGPGQVAKKTRTQISLSPGDTACADSNSTKRTYSESSASSRQRRVAARNA